MLKKRKKTAPCFAVPTKDAFDDIREALAVCADYGSNSELVEAANRLLKFVTTSSTAQGYAKAVRSAKGLRDRYQREAELARETQEKQWHKVNEVHRKLLEADKLLNQRTREAQEAKARFDSYNLAKWCAEIETVSSLFANLRHHIEIIDGVGNTIDGLIVSAETFKELCPDKKWSKGVHYNGIPVALSSGILKGHGIIVHRSSYREPALNRNITNRNVSSFSVW